MVGLGKAERGACADTGTSSYNLQLRAPMHNRAHRVSHFP